MKSDADDQISLLQSLNHENPDHFLVFGQSKYCLKSTLAKGEGLRTAV